MGISGRRLSCDFYNRSTEEVAQDLLGKTLARRLPSGEMLRGIVVEVEAYLPDGDAASHSHRGPGRSNASMFRVPGTLYVYPIHSRHCLNVVTESEGCGAAVLIRAIEPLEGIDAMVRLRTESTRGLVAASAKQLPLTQGPGRLCQAMSIDRTLDGADLQLGDEVWLERECEWVIDVSWSVKRSIRIGISKSKDLPLRWFIDGNRFVSGCARDHTLGRTWTFL